MKQSFGKGKKGKEMVGARSLYSLPPALGSTPWLVLSHGRHKQIQTFFNPLDGSLHHRSIPEMRQKYCFGCSNGHLMMLDLASRECYLLSLSSMETFSLPSLAEPSDSFDYQRIFVLSSAPNHIDCTIVLLKDVVVEHMEEGIMVKYVEQDIMICKPYEKEWRILHRIGAPYGIISSGIADSNGKVYLHCYRNKLISVDTHSLEIQQIHAEDIEKKSRHTIQTLIQSHGDLLVVIVNLTKYKKFQSAEVYRLNNSQSAWERLESIGSSGALFVGDIGPTYLVNDARVKNDSIYFKQSSNEGMSWYRFAMDESDIILQKLFCPNLFKICYESSYLAMAIA